VGLNNAHAHAFEMMKATLIGSRRITRGELRRFFKQTLAEEYTTHAVVLEDAIKKIFVYGSPFTGISVEEIINQRENPSWYEAVAARNTAFAVQRAAKMGIEVVAHEYFEGERQAAILNFAAYLRAHNTPPKWDAWNTWKAYYKGKVLCWVKLNPFVRPAEWVVSPCASHINVYENAVVSAVLTQLVCDNIKRCHPACVGVCSGAKPVTLLGSDFTDICNEVYAVNNIRIDCANPDAVTLASIQQLLALEKDIRGGKPHAV